MLKRKLCQARLSWKLHCPGALLIADGRYRDKLEAWKIQYPENRTIYPNQLFISRTPIDRIWDAVSRQPGNAKAFGFDYYIPGTSLRGPLRAQAERILRSIGKPEDRSKTACDPFADKENADFKACSHHLEGSSPDAAYARICPACKLFGCAGATSRVRIADAGIETGYLSVIRDMIGIDRFSGGVHNGANMHFHVLENAHFTLEMEIDNFELWHLGLLAYVFRDVQDGLLPIGAGKTKGFGLIQGKLGDISITLFYPNTKSGQGLHDIGSLFRGAERAAYGFHREIPLKFAGLQTGEESLLGLYRSHAVKTESVNEFWGLAAGQFNDYMTDSRREAA